MGNILLTELIAVNEGIFKNIINKTVFVVGMLLGHATDSHAEIYQYYGKSMVPALPEAPKSSPKVITVEKIPWDKLKIGMVVAYKHKTAGVVFHRIFKQVSKNEWWTKGDNNFRPDNDYVTPENYLGVVKNVPDKK